MRSSWIKRIFAYALMLLPTVFLVGLVAHVAAGAWIAAIFADPARFADAPPIVQRMTRSVYQNTRTHWQIQEECIEFDSELLYRPRPGTCRFRNSEFDTLMHFDERGFRETSSPPNDSERRGRIIVVGDSHAMGWGVEDQETFASRLAEEHGFETLNLGVSSYGTVRELKLLQRSVQLEPSDVLVIQYSDNDLEENLAYLENGDLGPYELSDLDPLVKYRPTPAEPLPIAGQVFRRTYSAIVGKVRGFYGPILTRGAAPAADPQHPARTLLSVIDAFPFVHGHQILIVAINGSGGATHLEGGRQLLESAGLTVVAPVVSLSEFYQIDDHMRPAGHLTVAASVAETIAGADTSSLPALATPRIGLSQ